ncbi:FUSC family protein [Actinopolymorpha sp. NPDC004070]|uniref:FUSC family protein n=1 Tax=Actinopolymorpha sp. NPDC004070 TaxID=3154548 RepID=UPI00339F2FC1
MRATAAAVIAYVVAQRVSSSPQPLLAPLTALIVVQVTLYATLTSGVQRVASVVVGVLVAVGFAHLVGLTWWSLAILIFASLALGRVLRLGPAVQEVAISGMLVMGVANPAATAQGRALETLIGAGVGVLLNLLVPPSVYVQTAGEAVDRLADQLSDLLHRMAREIQEGASAENAGSWLSEARRIDREFVRVDIALVKAEDSLRLNPRGRQLLHTRLILRSRMDTLDHCAVSVRSLCRTLVDLCGPHHRALLSDEQLTDSLGGLLSHLADSFDAFGVIVTTEIAPDTKPNRDDLDHALAQARMRRDAAAELLRSRVWDDPQGWELAGALLAAVDRLMTDLQVGTRPPGETRRSRSSRIPRLAAHRLATTVRVLRKWMASAAQSRRRAALSPTPGRSRPSDDHVLREKITPQ